MQIQYPSPPIFLGIHTNFQFIRAYFFLSEVSYHKNLSITLSIFFLTLTSNLYRDNMYKGVAEST
jgi:hypothetical protein